MLFAKLLVESRDVSRSFNLREERAPSLSSNRWNYYERIQEMEIVVVKIISAAFNSMIYCRFACTGWNASVSYALVELAWYRFAGRLKPAVGAYTYITYVCKRCTRWRCKRIFQESRLSKVFAWIKAVCPQFINITELKKRLYARITRPVIAQTSIGFAFFFNRNISP